VSEEIQVNQSTIRLEKCDITELQTGAFVYYARPDLNLGSGFGTAISVRGGPSIQEELKSFGSIETGEAVATSGGKLKARFVIHAVGPRFGEEGTEAKLRKTILSSLRRAEEKEVEKIAFPPMGAGFYGVPLDTCARVMLEEIRGYLAGETRIKEVLICVLDSREYQPFQAQFEAVH